MKAISSGPGLTMSMPASWPHRLPWTVKIEPSSATRRMRRRTSSAASTSTMLIKGIGSRGVSSLMQMCGVTAGSTACSAPAFASRSTNPAR
jgi:hypothetical protein